MLIIGGVVMVWEQAVTTAVQSLYGVLGGFADMLFLLFTFLAEDSVLMVVVFVAYWCVNKRLGEYLMLSLFASIAANGLVKDIVRRPRPFLTQGYSVRYLELDNGLVDTASLGHSYSFPSGHSQCAGGLWVALSLWFGRRWLWLVSTVVVLGVMASRVYLGVHFPSDVVVGALMGVALSFASYYLFNRYYERRLWLFAGVLLLLLPVVLLGPTVDTAKTVGVGLGALGGMLWEHRSIRFTTDHPTVRSVLLRLAVGVAIVMALRMGLKVVLPAEVLFDGIRYAITGFAATGIVPWLFVRFGL